MEEEEEALGTAAENRDNGKDATAEGENESIS